MEKHPSTAGLATLFAYYRTLAERALAQVADADLHRVIGADGNSIAVLMRHIAGNSVRASPNSSPAMERSHGVIVERNSRNVPTAASS